MSTMQITGEVLMGMIGAGTSNLRAHAQAVNGLNVFPIPDGDTGDNMLLTMQGGAAVPVSPEEPIGTVAGRLSRGMLMGARGNSGVILSQFFSGIADGLDGLEQADVTQLEAAFHKGVERAYASVMVPTEGTILTVAKDATRYAVASKCKTVEEFLECFLAEARRSLDRTPELLAVLKEAGVVDSGGAGLIRVVEGMLRFLTGESVEDGTDAQNPAAPAVDPDLFTEDSVMEFGYCTELMLRLQRCKTDVDSFSVDTITEYLGTVGDSIVAFRTGTIIKIHVHTMTPYKVLEFCQCFGEFLTVKIENMMLQHNEVVKNEKEAVAVPAFSTDARRDFAVIAVACGEGVRNVFLDFGADEIISGGQTMNPSSADFIEAFDRVNADTIFVLPNNGNIILAAKQAAQMYPASDVRVIPTHTIGDGYAILSMLDLSSGDADTIEAEMIEAMDGVLTAEISHSTRDIDMMHHEIHKNDHLGIIGKEIVSASDDVLAVIDETVDAMKPDEHSLLILISGKDAPDGEPEKVMTMLKGRFPQLEIFHTAGMQDIYRYILVAE